jgi:hypothetical protein
MKLERADLSKAAWMAGERAGAMTGEVAAGWTAAEMLGVGIASNLQHHKSLCKR